MGVRCASYRAEADARAAIGVALDNVVIGGFPMPARLRHVAVQDAVQLQDGALREGHVLPAFVDQTQRIAVAGHFLLRSALGRGVLEYQRLESVGSHHHTFKAIGGFGRLDNCHLAKIAQDLGRLRDIELLLAPILTQGT
jgi:hypothetical protein